MELLPLVCLWVLTRSGSTFAAEDGPSVVTVAVAEGSDAILPCSLSPEQNIQQMVFDWKKDGGKEVFLYDAGVHYNNGRSGQDEQFKGRVSHFEEQLRHGNASIMIQNTKLADSGNYTCVFPRLKPERKIFNTELIVGSAPKPHIWTVEHTKNWALLQCEVLGAFPKPSVQWKDRAGNILPAKKMQDSEVEGRYDIILQTTVTKTDNYSCVATQKEISHQIPAHIHVYFSEPHSGWSNLAIIGIITGLLGLVGLAGLVGFACGRRKKHSALNS